MDIEAIKNRVGEIQVLAEGILASNKAKSRQCYGSRPLVKFTNQPFWRERYHITLKGCDPENRDAHVFLMNQLDEKGVTEPLEITSEW